MLLRQSWIALLVAGQAFCQQYAFQLVPGSPKNVTRLFEDSRGRLWVGTPNGLLCFDGTRFYSLGEAGFPEAEPRDLAEDGRGGIWAATSHGLYLFDKVKVRLILKEFAVSVGRISPGVMLAAVDPRGRLGDAPDLTHNLDLYRIRVGNGGWSPERMAEEIARAGFTVDSSGAALFSGPEGSCELSQDSILEWRGGRTSRKTIHSGDVYTQISRDPSGCLWFRFGPAADYECPGGHRRRLPQEIASLEPNGHDQLAPDGEVLIPSLGSLAIGRPGAFRVARAANGYSPSPAVLMTRDGTVWTGSADGLHKLLHPFDLEYWTGRDGLENPFSILHLADEVFAASGQGVSKLTPDRQHWLKLPDSQRLKLVLQLSAGPNGTLMANGQRLSQIRLDGQVIADYPRDLNAFRMAQDQQGETWLSSGNLRRVVREGNQLRLIPDASFPQKTAGLDIEIEPHTQTIWGCNQDGLITKQGNQWRQIATQGQPLGSGCRSLAPLPDGVVWYGYYTGGAFARIRTDVQHGSPASVKNFFSGADIGDANVSFLAADGRGWLWRGSTENVYVSNPEGAEQGSWIRLDETDGVPPGGGNQNSFYNDPDGSVWWGADNNLVHFRPPANFLQPTFAPAVFISGYSSDKNPPRLADEVQTFPHGSDITAHIGSLQFDRRNSLRIRYRLDHAAWNESRTLDLHLGTLGWGSHTLEVQGRLFTGPWSGTQNHSFSVLKPLWLTWPVLLAFAGTALAGGTATYQRRKRRALRESKAFPDLAEWRLSAISPEAHALSGTVLDSRFQIGSLIARGGFAAVFQAVDTSRGHSICAIKVFRQEMVDKAWILRRFKQEVAALSQIRHPNVVRILGHGVTPAGVPYLAMEFIEGRTLRELLEAGGLPLRVVGSYLRQIGSALEQIHKRGILHRDLKPENLMIRTRAATGEELVLIDFSIAIVKEPDETIHGLSRAAGTIYYMAPEQGIGFANTSSDIYSLAKTVIEMLTGHRLNVLLPDASLDLAAKVRELLAYGNFGLSAEALDLLSGALEFAPGDRPQNARIFADRIAEDLTA